MYSNFVASSWLKMQNSISLQLSIPSVCCCSYNVQLCSSSNTLPVGLSTYLQLKQIAAWRDNVVSGMENEIREQLVKQLQESGHANVHAYCGPKQVSRTIVLDLLHPDRNGVVAELLAHGFASH